MKNFTKNTIFAATLFSSLWAIPATGQEIDSLNVKKNRVSINNVVQIFINFKTVASNSYCGLVVNYGDGTDEMVKVEKKDGVNYSIELPHSYKSPGQFTIQVEGKYYFRGLFSAPACLGDTKKIVLNVFDEDAEKLKAESAIKLNIAATRTVELEQQAAALKQKEEAIRQMELTLLKKELDLAKQTAQLREQASNLTEKPRSQPTQTPAKIITPHPKAALVKVPLSVSDSQVTNVKPDLSTSPSVAPAKPIKQVDGF
jgi:hypothetical protein